MGPERGFRAGSKGRQGGLSQRRGLGPQLPLGRGANRDTQAGRGQWSRSAPVGVSWRLASAAPVVLRSEGQHKVSPALALPQGPAHRQSLGLRNPKFLGIFLRPTLNVRKPTQPPSESKPTPLPPKSHVHICHRHRSGVQSQPGPQGFCCLAHSYSHPTERSLLLRWVPS